MKGVKIMRIKYILQIRRRYFWEDVLTFYSKDKAFSYLKLVRDEGLNCRLLEVLCIM